MSRFRNVVFAALVVGGALFGAPSKAQAAFVTLNFAATTDSSIVFSGGSFSFKNPTNAPVQVVTSVSNGTGDSVGLLSDMTGTFAIGTITTSGLNQDAPVTGAGQLKIYDGANTLTGNLNWVAIHTRGAGGTINVDGVVNVSNIVYTGTKLDLIALRDAPNGVAVATFQFTPAKSLTELKSTGGTTSFSTSLTATDQAPPPAAPAPAGLVMLASGAPFLLFGRFIRRRKGGEAETACEQTAA